ncbi:hypothetical protein S40288_09573 [Stachybotrys chartarum IBT 40288]|nr:hypothetical protein S40288_09573 [Stachybotrys chartarum IBT 40288]
MAFTSKSKLKLTIKTKPTPTGFKVWVVAQKGYFLGWVGHRPQQKYGPASKPPKALKELRHKGHGATSTVRSNYGIYKGLVDAKVRDKAGKYWP